MSSMKYEVQAIRDQHIHYHMIMKVYHHFQVFLIRGHTEETIHRENNKFTTNAS